MPPARGYWDQMMETDILSKNDTYHAINPAYPDTCCIHHLRYRSTYPYPLYGNGGNYISSLKPGESIQVNMAWIVNENDLNNMYLNLNGDGAAYEFSDSMLKTGLVDIYQ